MRVDTAVSDGGLPEASVRCNAVCLGVHFYACECRTPAFQCSLNAGAAVRWREQRVCLAAVANNCNICQHRDMQVGEQWRPCSARDGKSICCVVASLLRWAS